MVECLPVLDEAERNRYSRQLILDGFGEEAQLKLKGAKVAVVGVGGLGSPAVTYLTLAGVGQILIIDPDPVEGTNLNRQWLHWEKDEAHPKVCSAREKLRQMNGYVKVEVQQEALDHKNVDWLLKGADIVLDCLDNWQGRMEINDQCVRTRTPLVHGAVDGMRGQVTTVVPGRTPCLRCLLERVPKKQGAMPILGAVAGMGGSVQAAEAIKVLTGLGEPLLSRMFLFDLGEMEFEVIELDRKSGCPTCGSIQ